MAVERAQKRVSGVPGSGGLACRPQRELYPPRSGSQGPCVSLFVRPGAHRGWLAGATLFYVHSALGIYLLNREYICSRQAGTCSCGCLAAAVAPLGKRERSGDVVDPFCGSSQQQQRRSRRQRRRWRHLRPAAAARRRRDGQGLDNTGCGQSAIWAHGKSSCQSMAWEKLTMAWEKLTLVVGGSHMPLFERCRRCRSIVGTTEDL